MSDDFEPNPLIQTPEEHARQHYPWIKAWGRLLRLSEDEVVAQQLRADREGAPHTAISRLETSGNERWATLDDVEAHESRLYLIDWAQSYEVEIPHDVLRHWLDPHWRPKSIVLEHLGGS